MAAIHAMTAMPRVHCAGRPCRVKGLAFAAAAAAGAASDKSSGAAGRGDGNAGAAAAAAAAGVEWLCPEAYRYGPYT